jgi:hypothetical protein
MLAIERSDSITAYSTLDKGKQTCWKRFSGKTAYL